MESCTSFGSFISADTDLHNENSSANTETEQVSDITDDMPETKELVSNERDSLPADKNDERPTQDTSSNEQTDEKVSTEDASSGDAQNDENLTSSSSPRLDLDGMRLQESALSMMQVTVGSMSQIWVGPFLRFAHPIALPGFLMRNWVGYGFQPTYPT